MKLRFEQTRIGGRTQVFHLPDKVGNAAFITPVVAKSPTGTDLKACATALQTIEIGASIIHEQNQHFR